MGAPDREGEQPPTYSEATQDPPEYGSQNASQSLSQPTEFSRPQQLINNLISDALDDVPTVHELPPLKFRFDLSRSTFLPWKITLTQQTTATDVSCQSINLTGEYDIALWAHSSSPLYPRMHNTGAEILFSRQNVATVRFPTGWWNSAERSQCPDAFYDDMPLATMKLPVCGEIWWYASKQVPSNYRPPGPTTASRDWASPVDGHQDKAEAAHRNERSALTIQSGRPSLRLLERTTHRLLATYDPATTSTDGFIGSLSILQYPETPSQQVVEEIAKSAAAMAGIQERRPQADRYRPCASHSKATPHVK